MSSFAALHRYGVQLHALSADTRNLADRNAEFSFQDIWIILEKRYSVWGGSKHGSLQDDSIGKRRELT